MVEEYDSIVRNNVWDVVPRPEDKSVVEKIDYDETFSPIARYSSIRSMLALSSQMGWKIHQTDVKIAFLNGKIKEEVYIEQPEGFETFDREAHVCRLKRALYGLKQAPRAWYTKIDNYFTGLGFTKSEADANLYHIMVEGMEVWQKDGEVSVSQGKYANEILRRFDMEKCKPMQTHLVGNWRKEDATSGEVVAATVYQQLTEGVKLQGFIGADWVRSPSDRKSTSRGIFNLGSAAVSWYSRKQKSVALSLAKVEYMASSQVACEAIWMRKILVGLFDQRMDATVIYCDNQSCIKLSENPVFHDRSKHIDIRYHQLRNYVVKRIMLLLYVSIEERDANILLRHCRNANSSSIETGLG
eukprot:PITA_27206